MSEEPQTPGAVIRAQMEGRGWTQRDLARILGRPLPAINELIRGKRAITPTMAVVLSAAFGLSAEYWLRLESSFQLSQIDNQAEDVRQRARLFEVAPVRAMEARGWIEKTKTGAELEQELLRFFGVKTWEDEPEIGTSWHTGIGST
jgi:HTH-type transcriptional regulator / antitoxin HigA